MRSLAAGLVWLVLTWGLIGAAPATGLLLGVTVGAWLGWPAALVVAVLAWSRLQFRPSPGARIWRRQAAMQRRTAAMLGPLEAEGYVVLHDVTLPGWLDSLEHLVVGPTSVWVIGSWRRRRLPPSGAAPPAIVRGLRGQTSAVAEVLDGWARVPVRPLLCLHSYWSVRARHADGLRVAAPSQLPDVVRNGPRTPTGELGRVLDRLLAVLRPAG
jgi:hypothetical protein